jgi:hypothetical protein
MVEFNYNTNVISAMKYFQYRVIAKHMFKWYNLPLGLRPEKLEEFLIDRGSVCFFNTLMGHYVLPYHTSGLVNVYGDPENAMATPINGSDLEMYQYDFAPRILYDNSERQPFNLYLRSFSNRLAEIQKSIAILEHQARFPTLYVVDDSEVENWTRFQSKIDEGYPAIFVNPGMDIENKIKVYPSGYNVQMLPMLWEDYNKVEGEIYALLGTMFNVEQNKAAGVGPAETVMNYSQTFALANSRLEQRQRWCEEINAEFGLDMWVEKANDYQDIVREMMSSTARDPSQMAESAADVQESSEKEAKSNAGV